MLKSATFLGSAALIVGLASGAAAQDVTADTVIATVGDTEITLGQMIITRAQLPPQYQQLPADLIFTGILDQLIQQQLLSDMIEEVPARVTFALENERRTLLAGEAINTITQGAVTEETVQAAYDARFEGNSESKEYNASHLLVETEEEAAAARARIEEGAEFADVARDVSTGPTGPNGGNLGWFGAGQMVTEFEEAVIGMEPGDLAGPVQTQFGWHIIKLNETRVAQQPTLEELRNEISGQLQEAAITGRLAEMEAATTVIRPEEGAYDPALLNNLDLLEP